MSRAGRFVTRVCRLSCRVCARCRVCIMIAYGYAPARRVLRGRRAEELLAGGGAARRHAARGQPPDPLARAAARDASCSTARAAGSSRPRPGLHLYRSAQRLLALEEQLLERADGDERRRAARPARARRLVGPGRDRAAAAALRVPARAPGACTSRSPSPTRRRSSSSSRGASSSSASSAPPAGTARSSSSRSSATRSCSRARPGIRSPAARSRSTSCAPSR